ncbi:MAG TPA: hypothetical protein VD905_02185 [Flavobacteriales bacterium]|nr:hypothetical protein [Flavobacteriales bacterium]
MNHAYKSIHQAGQVGPVEWILIIIGILWLAGVLRNVIYVPVIVKEEEKKEDANETKISENINVSRPPGKGDPDEYVPFEEIKD